MMSLDNMYRWCDDFGGGLVIATSIEEARNKIAEFMTYLEQPERTNFTIWLMKDDDYFTESHPDVFDVY